MNWVFNIIRIYDPFNKLRVVLSGVEGRMNSNATNTIHKPVLLKDLKASDAAFKEAIHKPVLLREAIRCFIPSENQNFIDCTFNGGGHSLGILKHNGPYGKVIGIEWDDEILNQFKAKNQYLRFKKRLILIHGNYADILENWKRFKQFKNLIIDGILFDLGMSSWHLEHSGRGFSFKKNEPLDMKYDTKSKFNPDAPRGRGSDRKRRRNQKPNILTAEKIVNGYSQQELERIFREYGEERFAQPVAEKIVEQRKIKPIKTTFDLIKIIRIATPKWYQHRKLHFATKVFQALRIEVNSELENLKRGLEAGIKILAPRGPHLDSQDLSTRGGRIVIISFHSIEDRIVKNFLKQNKSLLKPLTQKPIKACNEEMRLNPRCRSAKLRAAELIVNS